MIAFLHILVCASSISKKHVRVNEDGPRQAYVKYYLLT
jgi:hypothetical protein